MDYYLTIVLPIVYMIIYELCNFSLKYTSGVIMVHTVMYRIVQNFGGEHFGEFGKTNVIRQYFTQPTSRFTKVGNGSYCTFANIFLVKTHKNRFAKVLSRQYFVLYSITVFDCITANGLGTIHRTCAGLSPG